MTALRKYEVKLTDSRIRAAKPREQDYELNDGNRGLRLKVTPAGTKVFVWYVKVDGKTVKVTIGRYGTPDDGGITLADAGEVLAKLKAANERGALPDALADLGIGGKYAAPRAPAPVVEASPLLSTVVDDFYKRRIQPHRKRHKETWADLKRDIIPALGSRPVNTITTIDCAKVVEAKVDKGAKCRAGKVLALLKQLLRFAEGRGLITRNPAASLDPDSLGVVNGTRKRWLTDEEIPVFWRALDAEAKTMEVTRIDYRTKKTRTFTQEIPAVKTATRAALKILLLTGVRSGELRLARWEHVDLDAGRWTIPVENQKSTLKKAKKDGKSFIVPLTPTVVGLFTVLKEENEKLRGIPGTAPWVMASGVSASGHYVEGSMSRTMQILLGQRGSQWAF